MKRACYVLVVVLVVASEGVSPGQSVNPVTINPNAGNRTPAVINYGPSFVYGTPYVYGGYPVVYGSGVAVAPGGYNTAISPFGGYGQGFGPGSASDNGWNDAYGRQQQYALANSRYEMQNAQASASYAMANYFQQKAIATAIQNEQNTPPPTQRFNVRTARPKSTAGATKAAAPTLPLAQLMSREGVVLWPEGVPKNPARDTFDAATASLVRSFQAEGKANVQEVNAARDALHAYGQPALTELRRKHPAQAPAFKTFLNSLDATLVVWAK